MWRRKVHHERDDRIRESFCSGACSLPLPAEVAIVIKMCFSSATTQRYTASSSFGPHVDLLDPTLTYCFPPRRDILATWGTVCIFHRDIPVRFFRLLVGLQGHMDVYSLPDHEDDDASILNLGKTSAAITLLLWLSLFFLSSCTKKYVTHKKSVLPILAATPPYVTVPSSNPHMKHCRRRCIQVERKKQEDQARLAAAAAAAAAEGDGAPGDGAAARGGGGGGAENVRSFVRQQGMDAAGGVSDGDNVMAWGILEGNPEKVGSVRSTRRFSVFR